MFAVSSKTRARTIRTYVVLYKYRHTDRESNIFVVLQRPGLNRRPRRAYIQEAKPHVVLTSTACEAIPGAILLLLDTPGSEWYAEIGARRSAERNRAMATTQRGEGPFGKRETNGRKKKTGSKRVEFSERYQSHAVARGFLAQGMRPQARRGLPGIKLRKL